MAIANECDICGKLYRPYNEKKNAENPNAIQFVSIDTCRKYFSYGITDCCPECMDSILQHIERLRGAGND